MSGLFNLTQPRSLDYCPWHVSPIQLALLSPEYQGIHCICVNDPSTSSVSVQGYIDDLPQQRKFCMFHVCIEQDLQDIQPGMRWLRAPFNVPLRLCETPLSAMSAFKVCQPPFVMSISLSAYIDTSS